MSASIPSSTLLGVDGCPVTVEAQVAFGTSSFAIIGLPDAACREARDRVRAAFVSSDLPFPDMRLTINLAPSNVRKSGCAFDLAMAIAVLVADKKLETKVLKRIGFLGELGLDGSIRPVHGIVPLVDAIDCDIVVVPAECVNEAAVIGNKDVRGIRTLRDLMGALHGLHDWIYPDAPNVEAADYGPDLSDVRGQPLARWAAEVAAAGGHNILFVGPPGSGKTMLAHRIPGLLPDLEFKDAMTATRIHSAAGLLSKTRPLITRPPFRAPHHTASQVSIAGGGTSALRPGEVTLAHAGVLFMDEMAEFGRSVLDAMRQPLEEGSIRIARASATATFPARFMLIGATNPCPCGEGLVPGNCRCGQPARQRYLARLSGPLLDRFDLRVQVVRPDPERFFTASEAESSAVVRERVRLARERALARGVQCNAVLGSRALETAAPFNNASKALLAARLRSGAISARGLDRVRRVALTLADLDGSSIITEQHLFSALELRPDFRLNEDAA